MPYHYIFDSSCSYCISRIGDIGVGSLFLPFIVIHLIQLCCGCIFYILDEVYYNIEIIVEKMT